MNTQDGFWSALAHLCFLQGRRISRRDLEAFSARFGAQPDPAVAACTLQEHGFRTELRDQPLSALGAEQLPALVMLRSGGTVVLEKVQDGRGFGWSAPIGDAAEGRREEWDLGRIELERGGPVLLARPDATFEASSDAVAAGDTVNRPAVRHWFWSAFRLVRSHYTDCAVAAVLVNLLALASSLFSMNVYDRVIPNGAVNTLWVLAVGVTIAAVLEFFLRSLRARLVDDAGKRADLVLSAAIFRKVLGLRPKDRPASSAQFASHVRDFDSVREFASSTTLVGLTDLPFAVLFLFVIATFGGELVWIPLVGCVLVLVAGAVSQWPMRRAIEQFQYESAQKFAYSVETFERLETIEALGAAAAVQGRWERLCAVAARSALRSRMVSAIALNFTQFAQQFVNTALIVTGVYLILAGQMTTGALIGCSILSGRALAPMSQIAGLMTRWQQARAAFRSLHQVMSATGSYDPSRTYLRIDRARGDLAVREVDFTYPRSEHRVLKIDELSLPAGSATALMGPVGSGKSTLLRVLAGLQDPGTGQVLLDGIDTGQIAPADFRAQVAWVGQDAVLFRGTLRENLLAGAPDVAEEHFLRVIQLTGIMQIANAHPHGLDMSIGEGGNALSGGQRQMVAISRALLADAPILLLDEPTSAFDSASEQALIRGLAPLLAGRTVVIATHRPAPLELVSRVVIVDRGQVVADGPRDDVLRAVAGGSVRRGPVQREVAGHAIAAEGAA